MILFDRVSKRYSGGQDALTNISFEIGAGELAFVTGHSGAGKSTLLKLIMHMEQCSGGQLVVNNQNVAKLTPRKVPEYRRQLGFVFQDHQLLNDRSVFENVALPLRVSSYSTTEASRRVRAALDKVGLLKREKANPAHLSTGEQQRVGIARAVVNRPRIILADEPTGNLDPQLSAETMKLFTQFQQVGVTLLIASHDLSIIQNMKHKSLILNSGRLVNIH